MDFGYLGEVVPIAIIAFLVLLAVIGGAITVQAFRYHLSGMAGSVPEGTTVIGPDATPPGTDQQFATPVAIHDDRDGRGHAP